MAGGSKQPTSQTVTQTSIPKEFYPYLQDTLGKGQAVTNRPYEAYPGPRLSDFSTDTKQAFDLNRDSMGSWMPFLQQGQQNLGQASNLTQQAIQSIPGSGGLQNFQAGNARDVTSASWGAGARDQYMSPYISGVLNDLEARAMRGLGRDLTQVGQSAQASGAYGGGRHAVMEQMARQQANERLQTAQTQGLNDAYNSALGAFGSDRDSALRAMAANQQSDLSTNKMNLDANLSVQDLGARMDMQKASLAMQGAQQLGALGQNMAGLGQSYANLNAQDIDRLRGQGLQQEQLNQASYDLGYQNFTDQRDYDKNNLAFMAGLVHGLPLGNNTTQTTQQYQNPYSQMVGAGLGLYGAYKNMTA